MVRACAIILVTVAISSARADLVTGGDIVVNEVGGPQVPAALVRIDPITGAQQVISQAGSHLGFTFDPDTQSFLVLPGGPSLIRVSAVDGSRQEVSGFFIPYPRAILVEPSGTYLVSCGYTDELPATLARFDPSSGRITPIPLLGEGIVAEYMHLDANGDLIAASQRLVARIDLSTGEVEPIASRGVHEEHFYGFALSGDGAFIAVSSDGPPAGSDYVGFLNFATGQITPTFTGLQRVVDVAIDSFGRKLILDQCQSQSPCAGSPVVYRENDVGNLVPLATGGHMFVASHMLILPDSLVPPDFDGDGVLNPNDNCRNISNPGQGDADRDGVGNACNDASDSDSDEWENSLDNCPAISNSTQANNDSDPLGNACDNCPKWSSLDQSDVDQNGIGNLCECGDQTGDGRVNVVDLVAINLAIFNPSQATPLCDTNFDGKCNVQDIVGANHKIFGRPAYCSRCPPPTGP